MTKKKEKELLKTPVFKVVEKEFSDTDFKPVGLNCEDWVMIIPVDEKSDKTLIVEQTRWGVEGTTIEWPAGTCEAEELPKTTAIREFAEETGIKLKDKDVHYLGSFNPNPAYFNNEMHVFAYFSSDLEKDLENAGKQKLDPNENCKVKVMSLTDLADKDKFENGPMNNAISLAAWKLLES